MDRLTLRILFSLLGIVFLQPVFGQDSTKTKVLEPVDIFGKQFQFKKMGLYDNELEADYNIRGFSQLTIFQNDLTDEFWTSEGAACITGKLIEGDSSNYLNVKWNKDQDECDWVGMGFGWDGWTGKDMGYVVDTLAIELVVRSTGKPFTNIPWAFCIEDYGGKQAWLGYNKSFLMSDEITQDWTRVEIPLSLFPFADNEVDLTSVKQLMIQVFSEGEIEIKQVKLIPFSRKLKQEVHASRLSTLPTIDGKLSDWMTTFTKFGSGHQFAIGYTSDSLYLAIKVADKSPLINDLQGNNLWNGDAIEIAFSTNPNADAQRKFLLLSDQHIGLNAGAKSYIWDFKEDQVLSSIRYKIVKTEKGYTVEMAIPFTALYQLQLTAGMLLDFEIAIDLGGETKREVQERWNSGSFEGFHTSPQKWGVLIFD